MSDTTGEASFFTGWIGPALALVSGILMVPGIAIGQREAGTTTTVNIFKEAQQGAEQMAPGTRAGTTTTINVFLCIGHASVRGVNDGLTGSQAN